MSIPEIAFTVAGGPEGAPLVVLGPSLGTSSILWEEVVPRITEAFRVIAWDLPGHGASPPAERPFTVAELADAVAAAVEDETFLYAGVSLGGATGLELMRRHPTRVDAAVIIASGALLGEPAAWHQRAEQVRAQSTSSVIAASAQRWFADGSMARQPDLSGRLLHALQDADDESYALCCEALAGYDIRDGLHDIAAPTLAISGEGDAVAPESKSAEIAEGVQRGSTLIIADAAHLPPAEQPATVALAMLTFFAESEGEADDQARW